MDDDATKTFKHNTYTIGVRNFLNVIFHDVPLCKNKFKEKDVAGDLSSQNWIEVCRGLMNAAYGFNRMRKKDIVTTAMLPLTSHRIFGIRYYACGLLRLYPAPRVAEVLIDAFRREVLSYSTKSFDFDNSYTLGVYDFDRGKFTGDTVLVRNIMSYAKDIPDDKKTEMLLQVIFDSLKVMHPGDCWFINHLSNPEEKAWIEILNAKDEALITKSKVEDIFRKEVQRQLEEELVTHYKLDIRSVEWKSSCGEGHWCRFTGMECESGALVPKKGPPREAWFDWYCNEGCKAVDTRTKYDEYPPYDKYMPSIERCGFVAYWDMLEGLKEDFGVPEHKKTIYKN